ncbi:MAG TPA: DUF192 domain-containing protein [Candidatus Deferrimicrobiaceae bacterium]|jgi:uncharacterized membrane protein (UPF0127 family)
MIVFNLTRGRVLAERADRAETFISRLMGLLGRRPLAEGEGLWISPCRGVHSIGMRYSIDVLFLDGQGKVIGAIQGFPPMRLTGIFREAKGALELPDGVLRRTETACGDSVEFRE